MKNSLEVTVLMPVYNEELSIQRVLDEVYNELNGKVPFEIIVVEDGSTDKTKEVLLKLEKKMPITLILRDMRRGYSLAILDGLKYVNTKYVLISDSDGQYEARDFWKLYKNRGKYDIVSGWRVKREDSLHRRVMSNVFQWLTRLIFKVSMKDITSSYRLMDSQVAQLVASRYRYMQESFWTEFTVIALMEGLSIVEVPIKHKKRKRGSTNVYKLTKTPGIVIRQIVNLFRLWLDVKKPLRS